MSVNPNHLYPNFLSFPSEGANLNLAESDLEMEQVRFRESPKPHRLPDPIEEGLIQKRRRLVESACPARPESGLSKDMTDDLKGWLLTQIQKEPASVRAILTKFTNLKRKEVYETVHKLLDEKQVRYVKISSQERCLVPMDSPIQDHISVPSITEQDILEYVRQHPEIETITATGILKSKGHEPKGKVFKEAGDAIRELKRKGLLQVEGKKFNRRLFLSGRSAEPTVQSKLTSPTPLIGPLVAQVEDPFLEESLPKESERSLSPQFQLEVETDKIDPSFIKMANLKNWLLGKIEQKPVTIQGLINSLKNHRAKAPDKKELTQAARELLNERKIRRVKIADRMQHLVLFNSPIQDRVVIPTITEEEVLECIRTQRANGMSVNAMTIAKAKKTKIDSVQYKEINAIFKSLEGKGLIRIQGERSERRILLAESPSQ